MYSWLLSHSKFTELRNITDYCWYVCVWVLYMFHQLYAETTLYPALIFLPLHPLLPIDHAFCLNVDLQPTPDRIQLSAESSISSLWHFSTVKLDCARCICLDWPGILVPILESERFRESLGRGISVRIDMGLWLKRETEEVTSGTLTTNEPTARSWDTLKAKAETQKQLPDSSCYVFCFSQSLYRDLMNLASLRGTKRKKGACSCLNATQQHIGSCTFRS